MILCCECIVLIISSTVDLPFIYCFYLKLYLELFFGKLDEYLFHSPIIACFVDMVNSEGCPLLWDCDQTVADFSHFLFGEDQAFGVLRQIIVLREDCTADLGWVKTWTFLSAILNSVSNTFWRLTLTASLPCDICWWQAFSKSGPRAGSSCWADSCCPTQSFMFLLVLYGFCVLCLQLQPVGDPVFKGPLEWMMLDLWEELVCPELCPLPQPCPHPVLRTERQYCPSGSVPTGQCAVWQYGDLGPGYIKLFFFLL